jgi:sugar fermentation stimulation protein A
MDIIPWLKGYKIIKKYPRVNGKIFDLQLRGIKDELLVELKSAVLRLDDHIAGYPDAPTKRGKEHLILLGDLVSKSIYKGLVVFICGLPRVKMFQLYCDVDKQIKQAVEYAASKGVIFKSINLYLDPYRRKVIVENLDLPVILKCKQ